MFSLIINISLLFKTTKKLEELFKLTTLKYHFFKYSALKTKKIFFWRGSKCKQYSKLIKKFEKLWTSSNTTFHSI